MRVILHSDLNNFYASCECLLHPEYNGKAVVVCGKIEDRHGVVLAKNLIAKKGGVKTGMTIFECKKIFPDLIVVEAHHDLYYEYSKKVKEIYKDYTDRIEGFGIDEAWLDVTESTKRLGSGEKIANEIRERVKEEIGLTVSVGVSFNKVFAKLGSDLKKPDAVTVIDENNYKEKIWGLPVEDLLFVGRATKEKLNDFGVFTIGGLARLDKKILLNKFGKIGEKLHEYANGLDSEPVKKYDEDDEIKSVGNSITFYKDVFTLKDVEMLFYFLSESVSERMKKYGIEIAKTIHVLIMTKDLHHLSFQGPLITPTSASNIIAETAIKLFKEKYDVTNGVRGVGVSVSNFYDSEQLSMGETQSKKDKGVTLDKTIENLRSRFGRTAISRAIVFRDKRLNETTPSGVSINNKKL